MKAFLVETPDGPFRVVDLPTPSLADDQVLVKIAASGINPLDTKIRAGQDGHANQPLPAVLGLDMAGVVESVGTGVTVFAPGDEVFGMAGGVTGLQGTLAEYIAADIFILAHKSKALTMRQAAALPLVTITAWEGLVDRTNVRADQTVLIHAGAEPHFGNDIAAAFDASRKAARGRSFLNSSKQHGATLRIPRRRFLASAIAVATISQQTESLCFQSINERSHGEHHDRRATYSAHLASLH